MDMDQGRCTILFFPFEQTNRKKRQKKELEKFDAGFCDTFEFAIYIAKSQLSFISKKTSKLGVDKFKESYFVV